MKKSKNSALNNSFQAVLQQLGLSNLKLKETHIILAVVGILTPIVGFKAATHRAIHTAEVYLNKGFGALAAETLDPYRKSLTSTEPHCKLLLSTYFKAQQGEKLKWAAESCLSAGVETPETYLSLALSQELNGKDAAALQMLTEFSPKFTQIPDFDLRIALIYKKNNKIEQASQAYLSAISKAPSNQTLSFDALQYFASVGDWKHAKTIALSLVNAPTNNPEVKLVLAQALAKGGDTPAALSTLQQARTLLAQTPTQRPTLEKNYPELFQLMSSAEASNGANLRQPASPEVRKMK